ncbi:MAG: hemerythrin domain-containing protein [Planctomycetales bacterium]|nr:hemerythrin domain-containing protein [Planctomycetales bacterium]
MNTKITSEVIHLFEDWKAEDKKLSACIEEIRNWMSEVNQLGIPHFGETASRLQPFRECLGEHFEREDAMLSKLAELYPANSPEVLAFKRQTDADHQTLIVRLDDLHSRLKETDPPFHTWTAAMDEVDVFFESMEQHERSESDRVRMLLPTQLDEGSGLM